jgi:hypothetical protein
MVLILAVILRGETVPSSLRGLHAGGRGRHRHAIDFPYSPVRLVVLMLPEDTSAEQIARVRTAAGMGYLISLVTLAVFLIVLRLRSWPLARGSSTSGSTCRPSIPPPAATSSNGSSATRALTLR